MATNIYVLKLAKGKWYVGKSSEPLKRYAEHLNGTGSAWTKLYQPISLEKTIANASPFDEDKVTKEYMAKYGVENVRGGSYCTTELDETETDLLNREIWSAQNKCSRCGRSGHFQKDCYAKTDVKGNCLEIEVWACNNCNSEFDTFEECENHEKFCGRVVTCFRCGRLGHYSTSCYARTHVRGYYLR